MTACVYACLLYKPVLTQFLLDYTIYSVSLHYKSATSVIQNSGLKAGKSAGTYILRNLFMNDDRSKIFKIRFNERIIDEFR